MASPRRAPEIIAHRGAPREHPENSLPGFARALALGADAALDPTTQDVVAEVRALTGGRGLDVAVDLVGSNAVLAQATASLGRFGRCVMVGLSLDTIELGPGIFFGLQSQSLLGHLGYRKRHLDELVRGLGMADISTCVYLRL